MRRWRVSFVGAKTKFCDRCRSADLEDEPRKPYDSVPGSPGVRALGMFPPTNDRANETSEDSNAAD
jgi:hypothetical protein